MFNDEEEGGDQTIAEKMRPRPLPGSIMPWPAGPATMLSGGGEAPGPAGAATMVSGGGEEPGPAGAATMLSGPTISIQSSVTGDMFHSVMSVTIPSCTSKG